MTSKHQSCFQGLKKHFLTYSNKENLFPNIWQENEACTYHSKAIQFSKVIRLIGAYCNRNKILVCVHQLSKSGIGELALFLL